MQLRPSKLVKGNNAPILFGCSQIRIIGVRKRGGAIMTPNIQPCYKSLLRVVVEGRLQE